MKKEFVLKHRILLVNVFTVGNRCLAHPMKQESMMQRSLYERLGGEAAIKAVFDELSLGLRRTPELMQSSQKPTYRDLSFISSAGLRALPSYAKTSVGLRRSSQEPEDNKRRV